MKFSELGLCEPLVRAVTEAGYSIPTPIQQQAIPAVLAGRDVVGIAQTGTGKTAAFALPLLHLLQRGNEAGAALNEFAASVRGCARCACWCSPVLASWPSRFTRVSVATVHLPPCDRRWFIAESGCSLRFGLCGMALTSL